MRPEDKELARLLDRFVPVRITSFKDVDMNRFKFDYDLTFAVLMMDAEGRTYARFGAQDHTHSTARMSIAGLKHAMQSVLAEHARAPKSAPPPVERPYTVADIPAFANSPAAQQPCTHCHHANNFRFQQLRFEGRFTKDLLYQYPFADNLGIKLVVDRNNEVERVLPGSPASAAGVRAGDVVLRAGDTPVYSEADLQFALNPLPDPASVTLRLRRDGRDLPPVTLTLPAGWRKSDISWRPSVFAVPPALGIGTVELSPEERQKLGVKADRMALRVRQLFPGPQWAPARGGLAAGDVLVGVGGEELPAMTPPQFNVYYRVRFEVGDRTTLDVIRGAERLSLPVVCIDPQRRP